MTQLCSLAAVRILGSIKTFARAALIFIWECHGLQEENDRLSAKVAQLSKTQGAAQTRVQQTEAPKSAAVTNFDILKRLSNLEREVFGKKLDQQASAVKPAQPNPNNYTNADTSLDDNEKTRQF